MDYYLLLTAILLATNYGPASSQTVNVDVHPNEVIVKEGEPAEFVCRVGNPILYCLIKTPYGRNLNLNPQSQIPNLGVQYKGEGFASGQCGIRIERTSANDNGVFECNMGVSNSIDGAAGFMKLTVARPPMQPELRLLQNYQYDREYNEGDTLEASCIVRQGRPPANITYMMGNETVHSGISNPMIAEDPQRSSQSTEQTYSVMQNITRILTWRDHGKKLRCIANHVALDENRELATEVDVQVRFGPQSKPTPIEQYGFMEGSEGVITVDVYANPAPRFQWRVDNQDLVEGESNNDYTAEIAQHIESGKYEARLRIAKVAAADIDKKFILTAQNDIGTQSYTVRISTSPAASETDLGIVGIVAIVISVLILFIIILLVCFARMTGRWCFADDFDMDNIRNTLGFRKSEAGVPIRSDKESSPSPTHEGGFQGFWARLTPNYRSVSTMEDLPPVPITLPPESAPLTNEPATQTNIPDSSNTRPPVQETNLDTLEEERGGALHSSDTESADRAPASAAKEEGARKSFFKMPAFLSKKSAAKQTPLEDVKTVPVEEEKTQKNAGVGTGDSVVYAELDLGSVRKPADKPIRRDESTEYAQIMLPVKTT